MRRPLIPILLMLLLLTALTPQIEGRRRVTTRRPLRQQIDDAPATVADTSTMRTDTIVGRDAILPDSLGNLLRFCGYEKTLRATRETLFLDNRSDAEVSRVVFTIDYLDTSGRIIHSRVVSTDAEVPARQTRRIDIRSWDTQKTYYYLHGSRPRVEATPYDVRISLDTLYLKRPCSDL